MVKKVKEKLAKKRTWGCIH